MVSHIVLPIFLSLKICACVSLIPCRLSILFSRGLCALGLDYKYKDGRRQSHRRPQRVVGLTPMSLDYLSLARDQLKDPKDREFAIYLDSLYSTFRSDFHIPTNEGVGATEHPNPHKECIYFCGNSLGLQPKLTKTLVQAELDIWASRGVQGHFRHDKWPWVSIHETCTSGIAAIVGADVNEVAIMGSLTANLHLLMAAFYTPTPRRHKIIIESKAFPSDHVCRKWDGSHSSMLLNLKFDGTGSIQLHHLFK
jgi:hypothetical protein